MAACAPGIAGHNVQMEYFAFFSCAARTRAVLDKTELPGGYDVNLLFIPDVRAMDRAAPAG